jgi:hypothetical protein
MATKKVNLLILFMGTFPFLCFIEAIKVLVVNFLLFMKKLLLSRKHETAKNNFVFL